MKIKSIHRLITQLPVASAGSRRPCPARESMIETLRHAGYQADACLRPPRRCAWLATESYDVVITDLRMPGMSGLEFIRAVEDRPHGAQILMVTAHATVASAVEAMRHGAFDYIEKPFDADQFEQLVARATGTRPCRRSAVAGAKCRSATDSHDRFQPNHAVAANADRPSGSDARDRADYRRKRHGQGAGRPLAAWRQ